VNRPSAEGVIGRVRDRAGIASLIACPVLLAGFLTAYHGLPLMTGLRAMAALYVLGIAPGYLIQRYFIRIVTGSRFEMLLSSFLLGMLITPPVWYLLCWAGLPWVFVVLVIASAAAVPVLIRRNPNNDWQGFASRGEAVILWVSLGIAILWSCPIGLVEPRGDEVLVMPYTDHILHVGLVGELARGVPAAAFPFLSGVHKWAYHQMPDVWCDLMRRAAGTDARTAYFFLALPLRYVLLSLAAYLAISKRFGRNAGIAAVLCMFCLVGLPERIWVESQFPDLIFHAYPAAFGLITVFLILFYVSLPLAQGHRNPLLLASFLSGLLLWYKANFALAVVPAMALFSVWILGRRRDYLGLMLCLSIQVACGLLRLADNASADLRDSVIFAPLAFLQWYWGMIGQMWWGTSGLTDLFNHTVFPAIDTLPSWVAWPARFVLLMVRRFPLILLVVPYAVVRLRFGRGTVRTHAFDVLALAILLISAACLIAAPVMPRAVWNVPKHLFLLVDAMLLGLAGVILVDMVTRLTRQRRRVAVVGCTVLILLAGVNAFMLWTKVMPYVRGTGRPVSRDFYACCLHLNATAPPDAVILHPLFRGPHHAPSLLIQRRFAMDFGDCWNKVRDVGPILNDVEQFYAGTTAETAYQVLKRYRVDYVMAEPSLQGFATYSPFLTEVYRQGRAAVYRVHRSEVLASASAGVGP